MHYSPWADAAERYPEIDIERCDISPARGVWVPDQRVILIDASLDRAGRRATLAHEIAHIDLQHRPRGGWFGQRIERDADRLAAQRLITLAELIAVLSWTSDRAQAAEALDVPPRVVARRMADLSHGERAALSFALEHQTTGV